MTMPPARPLGPPRTSADLEGWALILHNARFPSICCYCAQPIHSGQSEFWARKNGRTFRWHLGCDIRVIKRQPTEAVSV